MAKQKNISRGKFIYYSAMGTLVASIPGKLIAQVCELTSVDIAGPFYVEGSPIRTLIADPEEPGTRLFINGQVKGVDCQPIQNAMVEVWHADDEGCYSLFDVCDNGVIEDEFKLRGKMFTNQDGQYGFESILPANYANRPKHIHYKITSPDGATLITQLYFEGDPLCETDPWCSGAIDRIIPLEENYYGLAGIFEITLDSDLPGITMGDVNQDGNVNILDIVTMVNFILGQTSFNDFQAYVGDLNNDGQIDVLDIVSLVNYILLTPQVNSLPVTDPKLYYGNGTVKYSGNGDIAGIQMKIEGDFELKEIPHQWNVHYNNDIILIFSEDGSLLTNETLFTYTGDLVIKSSVIADWGVHRSSAEIISITDSFTLSSAYPNPFNPVTRFKYEFIKGGNARIYITDLLGREKQELFSGYNSAGDYEMDWNASDYTSGVYFINIQFGGQIQSRKITLLK